ncbi:hypothetical protein [Chryseobacterium jejuense]|uniref:Lipoprotein n=1 Tax=Chryseobacterium jejuense TaxID=445960 RepID=A0A2X2WT67_CHRJE|nr:hypothetical protein [Chryseobacterium jejuense]SDI15657.1 hypothetical protein SAMN05421542_0253 [Chryseobacterium jejuense]SQB46522.1 Uncharacterised protein [Chryseobacterium jejuense]
MKKIIPLYLLLLLVGCKKSTETNTKGAASPSPALKASEKKEEHDIVKPAQTIVKPQQENIDFINYSIDDLEGITSTGTEGVYRNFDFSYRDGETLFILVPKIGAAQWYSQQASQYKDQDADTMIDKKLSQQSFKGLSKEFNIFIFHTPKKYLKHTPNLDAPYTPQIPRTLFVYEYNTTNNSWKTIDYFDIKNDNDEVKANEWRENFTSKLSSSERKVNGTP